MNTKNSLLLKSIIEASGRYSNAVIKILDAYKAAKGTAQLASSRFKDEDAYIRETMQAPTQAARRDLAAAGKELATVLRSKAADLKKEYLSHLQQPISEAFLAQLRVYNDFQIIPTRLEVEGLLALNKGNSGGLRALQAVLQRVDAPYQLKFREPAEFENDLRLIEKLAADVEELPAVPIQLWAECQEILNSGNREPVVIDGVTYRFPQDVSQLQLNISRNTFDRTTEAVKSMVGPWTADASYELADAVAAEVDIEPGEAETEEQESGTKIEDGESGVNLARELGGAEVRAKNQYEAAVNNYVR